MTLAQLLQIYIKFFFILTPFFVTAVFLALTEEEPAVLRRALAWRITLGIAVISIILLCFGDAIFAVLGITVDAFRVGAGALLFLSSVSLVQGKIQVPSAKGSVLDLAVVPLAIPITLGPGSIGALLVLGSESDSILDLTLTGLAVLAASLSVGLLLLFSQSILVVIGRRGLSMLSKLTGLVLAALSSHMILTGAATYLH